MALMHEIGHAIGLKHSFEAPVVLPSSVENRLYTIMSYTDPAKNIWPIAQYVNGVGSWLSYSIDPETPMVLDILAIQYLYGVNYNYRSGNDVYTFDPLKPFFKTIWDGGGVDTISIQNFSTDCKIDLTAGSYSSLKYIYPAGSNRGGATVTYDGTNNLGIAYNCTIENVIGGSGKDQIIGNSVSNDLSGGAGDDSIQGGEGNDTVSGGSGNDSINLTEATSATDVVIFSGGTGTTGTVARVTSLGLDTITAINLGTNTTVVDQLQFSAADFGIAAGAATRGSSMAISGVTAANSDGNLYILTTAPAATVVDLNGTHSANSGAIVCVGAATGTAGVSVWFTTNEGAFSLANSVQIATLVGVNTANLNATDFAFIP